LTDWAAGAGINLSEETLLEGSSLGGGDEKSDGKGELHL